MWWQHIIAFPYKTTLLVCYMAEAVNSVGVGLRIAKTGISVILFPHPLETTWKKQITAGYSQWTKKDYASESIGTYSAKVQQLRFLFEEEARQHH